MVAVTLAAISVESHVGTGAGPQSGFRPVAELPKGPSVPLRTVLSAVAASSHIKELPSNLKPSIKEMVSDHLGAVKLFENASKSADPDIAAFAQKTLPTLQHHLMMAQDLAKTVN